MMHVFICPDCGGTRMVSLSRSLKCPMCCAKMANCELDYMEWIHLTGGQRKRMVALYRHADREKLCFTRPIPFYDRLEHNYYL